MNAEKDRSVKGSDCRHYSDKRITSQEEQGTANQRGAGHLEGDQRHIPGHHHRVNHARVIPKETYQMYFRAITKVLSYNHNVSSSKNTVPVRYSMSASHLKQLETKVILKQTIMSNCG